MPLLHRRALLAAASGAALTAWWPGAAAAERRRFDPRPGPWRTVEMTTTVELLDVIGPSKIWVPIPSVDSDFQRSLETAWSGNPSSSRIVSDAKYGARMVYAEFASDRETPTLSVTSRVRTRDRATDWNRTLPVQEDPQTLRAWLQPTELMPTDGIVRETALEATRGARSDVEKAQRLYDWIVTNTHRDPAVRGCGIGDIRSMLETRNFGGKCGDINALFVGLSRAAGLPARDLYGIRLLPSAFGYRELGANPSNLKSAQHCRAEVFLKGHGWVAMDPADVGKVMRQEAPQWIKDPADPLVAPVRKALFGGWEGNWLAYNMAHDVDLPGASGPRLGFLMYPQAEHSGERVDALSPDQFRYTISARRLA